MAKTNGVVKEPDYRQLQQWLDTVSAIKADTDTLNKQYNKQSDILLKTTANVKAAQSTSDSSTEGISQLIENKQYGQLLLYLQQHTHLQYNTLNTLCEQQIAEYDNTIQQYCNEFGIDLIPNSAALTELTNQVNQLQSTVQIVNSSYNSKHSRLATQYEQYNTVLIEKHNTERTIQELKHVSNVISLVKRCNSAVDKEQYLYFFKLTVQIQSLIANNKHKYTVHSNIQQYIKSQIQHVTQLIIDKFEHYIDQFVTFGRTVGKSLYSNKYTDTAASMLDMLVFDQTYYINPQYTVQYKQVRVHQLDTILESYAFHSENLKSECKNLCIDLYGYYSIEQYIASVVTYMYANTELIDSFNSTIKRLTDVLSIKLQQLTAVGELLQIKTILQVFGDAVRDKLNYSSTAVDAFVHTTLLNIYSRLVFIDKQVQLNTNLVEQFAEHKYVVRTQEQLEELQVKYMIYNIDTANTSFPFQCNFTVNLLFVLEQVFEFVTLYSQYTDNVQYSTPFLLTYIEQIYFLSVKKSISYHSKNVKHFIQLYENHVFFTDWFCSNVQYLFDTADTMTDTSTNKYAVFDTIANYIYTILSETILENVSTNLKLYTASLEHYKLTTVNINITELLNYITQVRKLLRTLEQAKRADIITAMFTLIVNVYDEVLFSRAHVKKLTFLTLHNANQDLTAIQQYVAANQILSFDYKFNEIQQYISLILSNDILDFVTHKQQYPVVTVHKLLQLLDKYSDLPMLNNEKLGSLKLIKRKQIDQVVKQLRPT